MFMFMGDNRGKLKWCCLIGIILILSGSYRADAHTITFDEDRYKAVYNAYLWRGGSNTLTDTWFGLNFFVAYGEMYVTRLAHVGWYNYMLFFSPKIPSGWDPRGRVVITFDEQQRYVRIDASSDFHPVGDPATAYFRISFYRNTNPVNPLYTGGNDDTGVEYTNTDVGIKMLIVDTHYTENNIEELEFYALDAALPDIIVTNIEAMDATGPDLSYRVTVKNIGDGATTGKFKNRIYLSPDATITPDDHQINDWNCYDILNANQSKISYDLTSTVTELSPGEYYMGVIADAKEVIEESDETNNILANLTTKITIPDEGGGGGGGSMTDGFVLEVPMTHTPPTIDGNMDPVWYSVCSVPLEKSSLDDDVQTDDWLDTFASFKAMYDDHYFYILIRAQDDIINTSNGSAWENDSFEIYFDGDNSKNDLATGYDGNDKQLRYVYGQTSENNGTAPHSNCKFMNTAYGYNCEVRIPAQDMTFGLNPGHDFGFEVQFNDDDSGTRDHLLKWWSASNNSWQDASLFGTAVTTDYIAASPAYVLRAANTPVIDGVPEESAWEDIPWFSINKFADRDNGALFSPPLDLADVDGWSDCWFTYKMMWRGSRLYLYAQVYDNVIDTSHPDWYMNDCVEVQIDGNNDKGQAEDGNDYNYNMVYSTTPTGDAVFTQQSYGWSMEAQMDLAADLGISPSIGHQMGIEVQIDDNDGGGRDLIGRWWSNDNITWTKPSYRGTVELTDYAVVEVDVPGNETSVNTYHLDQNYPNPFNPSTTIRYAVPKSCHVSLTIYDLLGKQVAQLVNETQSQGEYSVIWNGQDRAAGIYLYQLRAGDYIETRKLILQK
ncbi:T9SS type A sorting domain-containing protein [bacterium]|nr:T9SS type A sorting domain-containing protein [bacterium]